MTGSEVLSKIFTKGDKNENYIDVGGDKISTAQLIEPSLALSQMTMQGSDHKGDNNFAERLSFRIPLVTINDYLIPQMSITNFHADYSTFLPTMMVEFIDLQNEFLSLAFPKEGSTMQLYIGGLGDEMYYKPIRQDFIITNVNRCGNPGTTQRTGGPLKYRISGTLSVPGGARKESWCDASVNARQALFNLSVYTGLGFATNFTKDNDVDKMQWNNGQNRTLLDFMKDIANHACYSQYSFFTSFIDQYYVFNFIECHSLLSHGGTKTDTPSMIYINYQQQSRPEDTTKDTQETERKEKTTQDEIEVKNGDSDLNNTEQKVSYYFITNNELYRGWSNYIEVYSEINNGVNALNDGYRMHVAYADMNSGSWGCNNTEFVLAPIDNLKRDGADQQISEFPAEVTQESYIPLNLTQTTNHIYLDTDMNSPDNTASMESFVSYGEVDTTNTFKHYYFAKSQNDYQMRCLKKCGLHIRLQNYHPGITKFSRIWVDIYDKNSVSENSLKPREKNSSWGEDYTASVEKINENILYFPEEGGLDNNGKTNVQNHNKKDPSKGTFNRALSGWYVVTEMKIVFDRKRKCLQTELILNRIEYKPNLKSEYELACKSINEKYRYDNTTGSWFNAMDDGTYFEKKYGSNSSSGGYGGSSGGSSGGGGGGGGGTTASVFDPNSQESVELYVRHINPRKFHLSCKFTDGNNGKAFTYNQSNHRPPSDSNSNLQFICVGPSFYEGDGSVTGQVIVNGKVHGSVRSGMGGFVLHNDGTFEFCSNSTEFTNATKNNVKYAWQNYVVYNNKGGRNVINSEVKYNFQCFAKKGSSLEFITTDQRCTYAQFRAAIEKRGVDFALYKDTNGTSCYGWSRTTQKEINKSSKKIKNGVYYWGGSPNCNSIGTIVYETS